MSDPSSQSAFERAQSNVISIPETLTTLLVVYKNPENDPLLTMGDPESLQNLTIKIFASETRDQILAKLQQFIPERNDHDATVMLFNVPNKWSHKTTGTLTSKSEIIRCAMVQIDSAIEEGRIQFASPAVKPEQKIA